MLGRIDIVTLPPFVFGALPFIEGFIHDQQPHLVAQIQQMRIRGIMSGSQRIDARRLKEEESPRPNRFGYSCPQCACVMMNADPLQFHRLSIQVEACVAVEADGSQADTHIPSIGYAIFLQNGTC